MNTNQLYYLIEINKQKSLNAAAQSLHISPQALGASITNLEKELNTTLLERTRHGTVVSSQGQQIILAAQRFFDEINRIVNVGSDVPYRQVSGTLNIVSSYECIHGYLPFVIRNLYEIAPGFNVNIHPMSHKENIDALQNGQAEIAITFYAAINGTPITTFPETFSFVPLLNYRIICQAHPRFAVAQRKSVSIQELLEYPLVLSSSYNDPNASMLYLLQYFGKPKSIHLEPNLPLYKELIRSGRGIGIAPIHDFHEQCASYINDMPAIPITDDITNTLGCFTKKEPQLSELALFFFQYIVNMSKNFI